MMDAHVIGWLVFGVILVGYSATIWMSRTRPLGAVVTFAVAIWCVFMMAFLVPTSVTFFTSGGLRMLVRWVVESLVLFLPLLALLVFAGVATHTVRDWAERHELLE